MMSELAHTLDAVLERLGSLEGKMDDVKDIAEGAADKAQEASTDTAAFMAASSSALETTQDAVVRLVDRVGAHLDDLKGLGERTFDEMAETAAFVASGSLDVLPPLPTDRAVIERWRLVAGRTVRELGWLPQLGHIALLTGRYGYFVKSLGTGKSASLTGLDDPATLTLAEAVELIQGAPYLPEGQRRPNGGGVGWGFAAQKAQEAIPESERVSVQQEMADFRAAHFPKDS